MKDRNWRNGEPGLVRNAAALGGLNHLDWLSSKREPTPSCPEGDQGDSVSSKQCPPRPLEPRRKRHVLGAPTLTPPPWWNMGPALWCRLVWTWVPNGQGCVYVFIGPLCAFLCILLHWGVVDKVMWPQITHRITGKHVWREKYGLSVVLHHLNWQYPGLGHTLFLWMGINCELQSVLIV